MRCLALADMVVGCGGQAHFVWSETIPHVVERVESSKHSWSRIDIEHRPAICAAPWDTLIYDVAVQQEDAVLTLAVGGAASPHWIVVDNYAFDRSWEALARRRAKILVFDDLANRPHHCDLLLDQTFGRDAGDYSDLVPDSCDVLAGSDYSLLRPEFAAARAGSLARRRSTGRADRVLVSLGMTDPEGLSAIVLERLLEVGEDLAIDVVAGSASPNLDRLRAVAGDRADVTIHLDVVEMASLMSRADIAIGAAGSTSWERCCLGLPSLTLVLAQNQQMIARNLEKAGAIRIAPHPSASGFTRALAGMLGDHADRIEMGRRAAALVDGLGCRRVFAAMQAAGKGKRT